MTRDHAVIAGAGMAGLLTAAALVDHYETVTLLEADQLEDGQAQRRGAPQAGQAHVLLARGAGALEELAPGLSADLVAAGASVTASRMGPEQGFRVVSPAGPFTEVTSSESSYLGASRGLIERTLRARVLAHPRVRLRPGVSVRSLVADPAVTRVRGVRFTSNNTDDQAETLLGDIVVDATGRRSSAPRWLVDLGLPEVEETVTHPRVGYASRTYRRPASPTAGWDGAMINARPGVNPRFGLMLPTENGTCAVGLGGFAGHYPPADPDGFLAWAAALPDPCLHEALLESEPLDDPRAYRTPTSTFRHFDRLAGHPQGFIAVGDAVAAFNPVYGQGMSVAALGALALREAHLNPASGVDSGRQDDPTDRARQAIAALSTGPWQLAAGQDRAWDPQPRAIATRLRHGLEDRYLRALQAGATRDPVIAAAFAQVMLMLAEPTTLTQAPLLARVASHALRYGQTSRRGISSDTAAARLGEPHDQHTSRAKV